jgi:hypothetical protein
MVIYGAKVCVVGEQSLWSKVFWHVGDPSPKTYKVNLLYCSKILYDVWVMCNLPMC